MELCDVSQIKSLLARHGFRFSKSMGQNFLIADWVPRQIAEASGAEFGVGVLEVGPGIGPLTRQLAGRAVGSSFTLPFSLSVLADYIAADRSAMNQKLKAKTEMKTNTPRLA